MTDMEKKDRLDLALPAAILALGQMLPSPRDWSARRGAGSPGPGQVAAQEDHILSMLSADAAALRTLGIRDSAGAAGCRLRLRAFAYLARRMLRERTQGADMAEAALAAMDPTAEPGEALLVARDAVGRMVADGALEARPDGQSPWNPLVFLPARALQWMCGGRSSLGLLLPQRLAAAKLAGTDGEEQDEAVPAPLPASVIRGRIAERVVGMEEGGQLDLVCGRLALHMVRAKMLASGEDPGTPNEIVLVLGESGTGKTMLCEQAGIATGLPQASCNAAELTASGYVGLSAEDGLRNLIMAARGRVEAARFGLMTYDEATKRARSQNDSVVNSTSVFNEILRIVQGQLTQIGGKRSGFEPTFWLQTYGTFFFLCGHAPGLERYIERRMGRKAIGFGAGTERRGARNALFDGLIDYGLPCEILNRVSVVLVTPPVTIRSLCECATSPKGVIAGYNRLLSAKGCILSFETGAIEEMARHSLGMRLYYRGIAATVSALAADAIARDGRDAVVVTAGDVRRVVARMDTAADNLLTKASGPEALTQQEECHAEDGQGCAAGGG